VSGVVAGQAVAHEQGRPELFEALVKHALEVLSRVLATREEVEG